MTYVVTSRCVDCRYTYCVTECPADCFYEITAPHRMLVIHPDECIDCNACVPQCPVNAIWSEQELPGPYQEWKAFNAEHCAKGTNVTEGTDPLPSARLLEDVQAEEKAKGWSIAEPSGAS
jgi:ferredoxin